MKNEKRRPEGRRSHELLPGEFRCDSIAPDEPMQLTVCPIACAGIRCVFACPVVPQ